MTKGDWLWQYSCCLSDCITQFLRRAQVPKRIRHKSTAPGCYVFDRAAQEHVCTNCDPCLNRVATYPAECSLDECLARLILPRQSNGVFAVGRAPTTPSFASSHVLHLADVFIPIPINKWPCCPHCFTSKMTKFSISSLKLTKPARGWKHQNRAA